VTAAVVTWLRRLDDRFVPELARLLRTVQAATPPVLALAALLALQLLAALARVAVAVGAGG